MEVSTGGQPGESEYRWTDRWKLSTGGKQGGRNAVTTDPGRRAAAGGRSAARGQPPVPSAFPCPAARTPATNSHRGQHLLSSFLHFCLPSFTAVFLPLLQSASAVFLPLPLQSASAVSLPLLQSSFLY